MFSWLRLDPRRRRFVVAGRGYDTWMPCQNLCGAIERFGSSQVFRRKRENRESSVLSGGKIKFLRSSTSNTPMRCFTLLDRQACRANTKIPMVERNTWSRFFWGGTGCRDRRRTLLFAGTGASNKTSLL